MPRVRASVYNHFTNPTESNTLGNCKATCMHCGITVSGSTKATSNFRRHLQRRHPEILQVADCHTSTNDQQTMRKFTLEPEQIKWRHCDPHQIRLNDQLVKFIAADLLPLSTVESASFRELLQVAQPRFNVPSRKYLSTILLPHQYAIIRGKLKAQTQSVQNICVSLDLWSSTDKQFFIGILAHFILDFTQHSVMLGCRRSNARPNADIILQMYNEIVTTYDIANKVSSVVTDNISKGVSFLPETVDTDNDEEEGNYVVPLSITDELSYLTSQHRSCFAHSLELVIHDSLRESAIMKPVMAKGIKLLSMLGYTLKSTVATDDLDATTQLGINATTWSGQLKMLRSIKAIPDETLVNGPCCKLAEYELELIEEICEILKPFEEVMDRINGEQAVTSSLVIACVRCLRQAVARQKGVHMIKIVAILESSIEKNLAQYEAMEDFKLAAMIDPRFKLDWCKDHEVQGIKDLLIRKADIIWSRPTLVHQPVHNKRSKMFSFMTSRSLPATQAWVSATAEVSEYLNQPCVSEDVNPLEYWQTNQHRYPVLAQLASQYLSIPASSKSVKRIYNNDGKMFRPETCNLSNACFEQLMFIRCNYKN